MLTDRGFDLWADGYDKSVGVSDEEGSYPFAGYKQILKEAASTSGMWHLKQGRSWSGAGHWLVKNGMMMKFILWQTNG